MMKEKGNIIIKDGQSKTIVTDPYKQSGFIRGLKADAWQVWDTTEK
ncbi:hypothetical protein SapgrDRAFT_3514 [Saprospira grandis DSM 2844]|uniref:Uncharacterized protein n=1 Tax=Saprospira grandis DSM 2844 TaxID=694433 RepID=J1I8I2_9BACT|nr:hypothetical protein [Saprospira grandis]EJF55150.1 hypothetical protein SapgrDRAFT_3514 [Saprospira grandis DSM 2844]